MPRFKSNWPFLLEWEVVPDLKKFMKYSVSFKKTRIIEVKTRIIEVLQTPGYNVSSRKLYVVNLSSFKVLSLCRKTVCCGLWFIIWLPERGHFPGKGFTVSSTCSKCKCRRKVISCLILEFHSTRLKFPSWRNQRLTFFVSVYISKKDLMVNSA